MESKLEKYDLFFLFKPDLENYYNPQLPILIWMANTKHTQIIQI